MAELRGFACDGGCGSTIQLQPHQSVAEAGWYVTFTPHGQPTLHACSTPCLIRAIERIDGSQLKLGAVS